VKKLVAADLRDKLGTIEDLNTLFSKTEPISEYAFPVGSSVAFHLGEHWQANLDGKFGSDPVDATVKFGPETFGLTKDALLRATSICGIPKGYALRTPANLIEPHLNYWMGKGQGLGADKSIKALVTGDGDDAQVAAFVRPSIQVYSNFELLERALDGIATKYGIKPHDVLVDYKVTHDINETAVRLVIPEVARTIKSSRPKDDWSVGLQINNSLTGATSTSLEGYLFAWVCTNGMTDQHTKTGLWSRKGAHSPEEMYEWAANVVDDVLGGLEGSLDAVQELTGVTVEGDVANTLRDVFREYQIPLRQREGIITSMAESPDLSMYSILAAVTAEANKEDATDGQIDALLRAGGTLPYAATHRCDACHRLMPV
jgi:hypothetical protein